MIRLPLAAPILLAASLAAAASCRNSPRPADAPSASARDALRPVATPALTGVEAGLQERIRGRHASLMLLRDGVTPVSDSELAAAYGEVGKLLLGAEFLADAEPYFVNARTLAPRELAWPYYLAHVHRLRNQPDQAVAAFQQALAIQ